MSTDTSTFITQYYRLRGHDAAAINTAETKVDWIADRNPDPQSFTYLSLWGGRYTLPDRDSELASRRRIAADVIKGRKDRHGRPLALAECTRRGADRVVRFPFFLDMDVRRAAPLSHDDMITFGREVVLPSLRQHYEGAPSDVFRLYVCAAKESKDESYSVCCGDDPLRDGTTCVACGTVYGQCCEDPAVGDDGVCMYCEGRPPAPPRTIHVFKTAVHYRCHNHVADEAQTWPVCNQAQAVAITSTICMRAIAERADWGTAGDFRDWIDVAPITQGMESGRGVPSLRVMGTVKATRCRNCTQRRTRGVCTVCYGSGKVCDDRPYRVVAALDAAGETTALPKAAETVLVTSVRSWVEDTTPGFLPCAKGTPLLYATESQHTAARSMLRCTQSGLEFDQHSAATQTRLRLPAVKGTAEEVSKAAVREISSPAMKRDVLRAIRDVWGTRYEGIAITSIRESPKTGCLYVNCDGRNATFCHHKGDCHRTSRIWFFMHPSCGIRQRCWSCKAIGGVTCRAWRGTEWQAISQPRRFFRQARIDAGFELLPAATEGATGGAWAEFRELRPEYHQIRRWMTSLRQLDYTKARLNHEPLDLQQYMRALGGIAPPLLEKMRGHGVEDTLGMPQEAAAATAEATGEESKGD